MTEFEKFREKLLSDPEVLREYEEQKAEYEVAGALIRELCHPGSWIPAPKGRDDGKVKTAYNWK